MRKLSDQDRTNVDHARAMYFDTRGKAPIATLEQVIDALDANYNETTKEWDFPAVVNALVDHGEEDAKGPERKGVGARPDNVEDGEPVQVEEEQDEGRK
jgi:hypothetical protein